MEAWLRCVFSFPEHSGKAPWIRKNLQFWVFWLGIMGLAVSPAQGAVYKTENFVVTAPTEDCARRIAECAEYFRRELAQEWLQKTLPTWYRPCQVRVQVGSYGAGGETKFIFQDGEVHSWDMRIQGSMERLLDSVVPHEVFHTVLATHFRRPLPRWADEGMCTLVEHLSERKQKTDHLSGAIRTNRRIPVSQLLPMTDYPKTADQVTTMYAEGYELCHYLVDLKGEAGKVTFLRFLQDAHETKWDAALKKHYDIDNMDALERIWTNWIVTGYPNVKPLADPSVAGRVELASTRMSPENSNRFVAKTNRPVRTQTSASAESSVPMLALQLESTTNEPVIPKNVNSVVIRSQSVDVPLPKTTRRLRNTARLTDAPPVIATESAREWGFPEARTGRE